MDYADEFLDLVRQERCLRSLEDLASMVQRPPFPIAPVIVDDFRAMTEAEMTAIVQNYNSHGAAHVIASNPEEAPSQSHPLFDLCAQLTGLLDLQHPFPFPLDFTEPFSTGSSFVPFTRPGCAVICRNRDIAHGRTAFIDGPRPHQRRVLSRKWFMTTEDATVYRHVPGPAMRNDIAKIAPELFGSQQLKGQWLYDQTHDKNVRVN